VGVWTVNDPAEARELVRLGAASIITDSPGEMLRALGGR
jgi:glycerophosphoryl diester phosphodiesterase